MDWFKEIKKSLQDRGVKEEIKLDTKIQDLGIDSLDLMDLIIESEKKYNFRIPDDKLIEIKTVKDLVVIIETLVK